MGLPWVEIIAGIIILVIGGILLDTLLNGSKRRTAQDESKLETARKIERDKEIRVALRALPPILQWSYEQVREHVNKPGDIDPQMIEKFDQQAGPLLMDIPNQFHPYMLLYLDNLIEMNTTIELSLDVQDQLVRSEDTKKRRELLASLGSIKNELNTAIKSYLDS